MKFLILTQYFAPEPGAAQVRLAAIVRQLVRAGQEVEIVTAMPNYPRGQIFDGYRRTLYRLDHWDGIPVHRVWVYASQGAGFKRMLNYASFTLTCLFGLLAAQKPDYIFVESPPLFLSVPGFLAAHHWKTPWIFNVADLWPDSIAEMHLLSIGWLMRAAFALERWTYKHATFVNAVTWGIHEQLRLEKHVPVEKLTFLPNGVDTDLFAPMTPDTSLLRRLGLEGKRVVIFPGTHGYAHGVESILRAAEKLRDDTHIHFLLLGAGSAKSSLVDQAKELGLQNITFLDPVSPEEVPRYIAISCCGLVTMRDMPLLKDARPVKALAIMGCAKPVVLAVGRGSGSFLKDAQGGLVVPIDDPDIIAIAIRYFADHPAEAAQYGRRGRAYVCRNLQWSTLVNDWLQQLPGAKPPQVSQPDEAKVA